LFGYSLTNNTLAASANNARLTAFGLGIDPDATGVTFGDASDGAMINASLDSIPSLKTIEVCVRWTKLQRWGQRRDLRKRRERYVLADNYGGFRERRDD